MAITRPSNKPRNRLGGTTPHNGYRMRKVDRVFFSITTSLSKTTNGRGASRFILFLFQLEQDESEQVVARELGYRADSAFVWVR